ncbi:Uncharacterised protein [uncultured archaeon]|nr:Uncharacterised protein [uncultured archaeon]
MKKSSDKLEFPLKGKYLAMLAPSFVADFSYPAIISQLKDLGFDKVVELTFGAKMINREYHRILKNSKKLIISSVCPGIVETIKSKALEFKENLISVDSPMTATAKICRKIYPTHKIVFISPCNFKKIEAQQSEYVDYTIDYLELKEIFDKLKLTDKKYSKNTSSFDKFYNDSTKIYPLAGGLYKTANLNNILQQDESIIIDGIEDVLKFLNKPKKNIRFLDVTFCKGGCIGGPCTNSKLSLMEKKKKVLDYLKIADKEKIPNTKKGNIKQAEGIKFSSYYPNR